MTTYSYNDSELSEINDYFERNAYYQQAKEKYNKGEEISFLPIGENANPDLLYILNDKREDARFNAFFVRNTIMQTIKAGNMKAVSKLITYLGQENQSHASSSTPHREMIESVVSEQLRKNPDWIDKLEPQAKFTIADIYMEKNPYKLRDFNYRTFSQIDDANRYAAGDAAKKLLTNAMQYKHLEQIPWEIKAQALNVATLNANNLPFMEIYQNLLNTAGDANREERVALLSEIAQNAAHLFQYENHNFPSNWAEKIPACEGSQKLFYNMMYYMKAPTPSRFSTNSWNNSAYTHAKNELDAQRIVDDVVKYKRGISKGELALLAQYRPEFLLAKKDLSTENKIALLKDANLKISDNKRLQIMNDVLATNKDIKVWDKGALKKEDIAFFLSSAENMKTVSPEMNKFLHEVAPFVKQEDEINKRNIADLEKANEAQKKLDEAQQTYNQTNNAQDSVMSVLAVIDEVLKHKSDDKDSFTKESLETLVFNSLKGKEPNKLDYQKQGKLASLFMSSKEKERQQKLDDAISKFNAAILEVKNHKDVFAQMKTSFNRNTYYQMAETAYKNLQSAQRDRSAAVFDTTYLSQAIADYEQDNLAHRLQNLTQNYETRRTTLQAKAREALSFTFKGQEFGGEPMLAEHEKRAKASYKAHAEGLRSKIKSAARKEMEERGVFEKPDIENPNQTGKPMTKESAAKVTKLMRDKKLYEKLAKD